MKDMKKLAVAVIALAALAFAYIQSGPDAPPQPAIPESQRSVGDSALAQAIEEHASDVQVDGEGVVTKILADDNSGSGHQKFIVQLQSGQTLLIAHNIDLAPRVAPLKKGDTITFRGEYSWNERGG